MSWALDLSSGNYIAGLSRPFFVSRNAITNKLNDYGFTNIQWHGRGDILPQGIDPKNDSHYSNDWNEWVSASYGGASKILTAPARPAWVLAVAPPAPAPNVNMPPTATTLPISETITPPTPHPIRTTVIVLGATAASGFGLWLLRRPKTR